MKRLFDLKCYTKAIQWLFFWCIGSVIRYGERFLIKKYSKLPLKHQPIFIIGAPRTGSTIFYQSLTNQFDVLYIDNFASKLFRNMFFGFWASNILFKQKAHNSFESLHGNSVGLHAPSECGSFWYRWFPKDSHFVDHDGLGAKSVQEINREITAITNYYDKPVVFKNLNAGQRLRVLYKVFPNAKFVFIRRDPFYTAQSILKAKRKEGLRDDEFWSIMPANVSELKKMGWSAQIVKQIYFLEKQIVEDSSLFSSGSIYQVWYQELNADVLSEIGRSLRLSERSSFVQPELRIRDTISVSDDESKKIRNEISKLNWSDWV